MYMCMHDIVGRRRGGMHSHVPNEVMRTNNRIARVDMRHIPSPQHAVRMYHEEGGRISDKTYFGDDPICADLTKCSIRSQAFSERFPSFHIIFQQLVNGNSSLLKKAVLFYIDLTYRLSMS